MAVQYEIRQALGAHHVMNRRSVALLEPIAQLACHLALSITAA
jgi:hypothetical protein